MYVESIPHALSGGVSSPVGTAIGPELEVERSLMLGSKCPMGFVDKGFTAAIVLTNLLTTYIDIKLT